MAVEADSSRAGRNTGVLGKAHEKGWSSVVGLRRLCANRSFQYPAICLPCGVLNRRGVDADSEVSPYDGQ